MKEFFVNIYPIKTGDFFTSFVHPLTKKRVRNSFRSRTEAQEHKKKIEEKFKRRQFKNLRDLSVGELLNLYMLDNPNNSLGKYSKMHLADFAETFSDFEVETLTPDVLRVWLGQLKKENDLKDITLRKIKCDFDGFFKYLVGKEIINESPLTEIYYARSTPSVSVRNILSEKEITKLLAALKDYSPGYLFPMIKMFVETGAKTSEVVELTWRDVDLISKKVKFQQTASSCERSLEISEELAQLLNKKKSKQGHVFMTYYGEPFTKNKIGRASLSSKLKVSISRNGVSLTLDTLSL